MNWKTIRLELAPTEEFPNGSVSRGFLIRVPLNDNWRIDEGALSSLPERAQVRRFWSTEPDQKGRVTRANGHLVLRCAGKPDRLLDLNANLQPGNEVTVVEEGGAGLPFRVKIFDRGALVLNG
jgi:hypothetical protein